MVFCSSWCPLSVGLMMHPIDAIFTHTKRIISCASHSCFCFGHGVLTLGQVLYIESQDTWAVQFQN